MNKKLITSKLTIASFIYALSILLSAFLSKWMNLALPIWIPTTVSILLFILHGKKAIISVVMGTMLTLLLSVVKLETFEINAKAISILSFSDVIVGLFVSYKFKHRPPFLNYIDDLKKFIVILSISLIIQSIFVSGIFEIFQLFPEKSFNYKIQHIISSTIVTTISFIPFLLSIATSPSKFRYEFSGKELSLTILMGLLPFVLVITESLNEYNSFPIRLLVLGLLIAYSSIQKYEYTTIFIVIFTISNIFSGIITNSTLTESSTYASINHLYLTSVISLLILGISAIINERDNAQRSVKESFKNTQKEVDRQTEMFRELNDKLLSEVTKRGIIEKELNLSKKLLTESQEIANITSWEYDLKAKTIRWSESASRILGIQSSQVSAFSMEKYIEKIHPDDKRNFLSSIYSASENSKDINLEIRYLLNNHYRHFLIRGRSFEENNEIDRIVGVLSDITEWKEAQVALTEKEIRYRALFEANIDPVILIDANTKTIIDVNAAFEKLYEYTKEEAIGHPYINISAQEYETHQALDITLQKGFYRVPSRIHRKKSGEEFYVEGHFVRFLSGQNTQIFAVLRDNTIRKNYEFKLSERELKFRLFFESNLIGMAETTVYKTWITFNSKLCKILGYKPDELEKTSWDKITHPEDIEFETKQFNNILQRKTDNYTLEKRFIKKDGSIIYCNVAVKAIKDNNGTITHLVKLIEDITLRKKAENALLESQNRLKKAQQIAHLGVCRLNMNTGYLDVSEEAFTILEWDKSNAPFNLENFYNTIHPADRNTIETTVKKLTQGEKIDDELEVRFINSEGNISYLSINIGITIDSNKKTTDLIITFADITTSKLAEESLKEANAMKDQLFSVISHDLRGPIGSVEQMLALLIANGENMDNDSKNEIVSLLHNTTKESYNLLENLLEWGRSQRQATIKPIQIEIQGIVSETVQLLSSMASAKNIKIETEINNECKAFVDPMMFKTIIRNLVSNAIKFTPNSGKITLNCNCNNQLCTIQVSDTGVGIPIDRIELIFDDSKVFSTSGTNSEKGTGLGLKLVKRFVDKNGGSIRVNSNEGQGTTFTITLPAQKSN